MKPFIKALISLVAVAALSAPAYAIMLEPYAGYEVGTLGTGADTYTGPTIGARLGFGLIPMFSAGIDYSIGSHTLTVLSVDKSVTATDLGVFAMFEFPVLIRVWVNYVIDATATVSGSSVSTGTATKLGFGYTGLPLVSINFEMVKRTYTAAGSSDTVSDTVFVSVGLPLP